MNDIIVRFIRGYLLECFVIVFFMFIIVEVMKEKLDSERHEEMYEFRLHYPKKYKILRNFVLGIQSIVLVAALVLTCVSIYSLTIPCQF